MELQRQAQPPAPREDRGADEDVEDVRPGVVQLGDVARQGVVGLAPVDEARRLAPPARAFLPPLSSGVRRCIPLLLPRDKRLEESVGG